MLHKWSDYLLAIQIRENDYAGKIEIAGIPNKDTSMSEPSQFYGDFMQTAEQAFPCPAP